MLWQIILISTTILIVHGDKLHEHMTKEEIESIFNVKHDQIHNVEYEVVPIHVKEKRHTKVKLRAFHQNYDLYLENNNHFLLGNNTPVFLAEVDKAKKDVINYKRIPYPNINNIKLYHDRKKRAAIATHKDENNKIHLDGVIGNDVVIRHVPPRIHNEILSNFPHIVKNSSDNNHHKISDYQSVNHVIIKPNVIDIDDADINSRFDENENIDNVRSRIPRNILNTSIPSPDVVYPELIITVNYDTFKNHSDIETLSKYIAAFWNAVDLRFREMSNPEVRLNIAGLIIPLERDAAPYFEIYEGTPKTMLGGTAVREIGKHFGKNHKFHEIKFDIAVGMVRKNLGKIINGTVETHTTGMAYMKGACNHKAGLSAAIFRDTGGFNGITTAAHEIAHNLGSPHDGDESKNISGEICLFSDGYLMSYARKTKKGMQWSRCSITAMRSFLSTKNAQCLRNKPNLGKPYMKILPGKLLNRDEQCLRSMGYTADKSNMRNCAILWCGGRTQSRPPAEGTSCGEGMICLDAECVKDPELSN